MEAVQATHAPISMDAPEASTLTGKRAALASASGSAIEYYEFGVYGFTAVYLGPHFFPSSNPVASLLSTLAVFGIAFFVRPVGGILLGRLGDRFGRRIVLLTTIVGMGIATAAIGMLPDASQVGLLAPILLVLCRLAQGFFAGGEVVGAAAFVAESAPQGKRGFYGSATPVGVALGGALAATVCGLTTLSLSSEQMSAWGWRIPFILAVPLVFISAAMRHNVEETPAFKKFLAKSEPNKAPIREVLTKKLPTVIRVILIAMGQNVGYWVGLIFMNIYLTTNLGYSKSHIYWIMAGVSVLLAAMMPFWGALSDRWGRKRVLTIGFTGYALLTIPMMMLMAQNNLLLAAIAVVISTLPMPIVQAVGYPTYSEQFPTELRYTGMAVAFNIATLIGGGFTPYLATWLISTTGNLLAPGFLLAGSALIAAVTLRTLPETAQSELT